MNQKTDISALLSQSLDKKKSKPRNAAGQKPMTPSPMITGDQSIQRTRKTFEVKPRDMEVIDTIIDGIREYSGNRIDFSTAVRIAIRSFTLKPDMMLKKLQELRAEDRRGRKE